MSDDRLSGLFFIRFHSRTVIRLSALVSIMLIIAKADW